LRFGHCDELLDILCIAHLYWNEERRNGTQMS